MTPQLAACREPDRSVRGAMACRSAGPYSSPPRPRAAAAARGFSTAAQAQAHTAAAEGGAGHGRGGERLVIGRDLSVFGRGRAVLRLRGHYGLKLTAPAATVDGLRLVGRPDMDTVVHISNSSSARLQRVHWQVDGGGASCGINVQDGASPTISGCHMIAGVRGHGGHGGRGVCSIGCGTAGRLVGCELDVGGSSGGIVVSGASPLISNSSARAGDFGIYFTCGAGGRLAGCTIENCKEGRADR